MKKETLLAFNDAVIAIIMTLMVLEIKLPGLSHEDFLRRCFCMWGCTRSAL